MAAARKATGKDRDALALFANELRAHRTAHGWTQADVAAKTAYSESLIAQVETRHKAATPELAKALGTTSDEIDEQVRGRLDRQAVLSRDDPAPPMLWALIDEGVLHRPVARVAEGWKEPAP